MQLWFINVELVKLHDDYIILNISYLRKQIEKNVFG